MGIMIHNYKDDLPAPIEKGTIAIDTEAMGLLIKRDRLCVVQIARDNGDIDLVQMARDYSAPNLKATLANDDIEKIFHFARFDLSILNYYLNVDIKNFYCTKIASKIARTYTQKHGLKTLCREFLKIDVDKQNQSSYWGADELSSSQKKYAADDVKHLHKLKLKLDAILKKEGRYELARLAMEALRTIVKLELSDFGLEEIYNH